MKKQIKKPINKLESVTKTNDQVKFTHSTRIYTYNGVQVYVKIDHINRSVDVIEGPTGGPKKWVFAGRGLEYMKGWQGIFDAMKHAVSEATKVLEWELAEQSKFNRRIVVMAKNALEREL